MTLHFRTMPTMQYESTPPQNVLYTAYNDVAPQKQRSCAAYSQNYLPYTFGAYFNGFYKHIIDVLRAFHTEWRASAIFYTLTARHFVLAKALHRAGLSLRKSAKFKNAALDHTESRQIIPSFLVGDSRRRVSLVLPFWFTGYWLLFVL
jgi:hypothetical protein